MAEPVPTAVPEWPGVSVIIPAYNYANFLPDAVDSVLGQGYPNLELIIVDDGSTDNTAEVAARYGEKIRYVWQKNAGLPAARNTGIRHAKFSILCFLDADDRLGAGLIRKGVETFASLPPEFGIVAFRTCYMNPEGVLQPTKNLVGNIGEEITGRDIILKTRFGTTGLCARREVFDECGFFDETLRSSEDRDMWIRIASRRRIFLHAEQLQLVRWHAVSMSRNTERMKENMGRVIAKAWRDRRVPRGHVAFWLRVRSFLFFQGAWMYYDQQRRAAAIRDLLFSLLLWPWFPQPSRLNEPPLFRLRALARFVLGR